ncbi:hypothetical protein E2C01_098255 [Portunus trituberculatus]|uniref:Uncharacterized protein n=1 Tax=Portunus trituberculatus TaxID=210409 RepID=A0A5B7KCG1_PORTR|nr:hypothetical protein [Portunus trituberculatus]
MWRTPTRVRGVVSAVFASLFRFVIHGSRDDDLLPHHRLRGPTVLWAVRGHVGKSVWVRVLVNGGRGGRKSARTTPPHAQASPRPLPSCRHKLTLLHLHPDALLSTSPPAGPRTLMKD